LNIGILLVIVSWLLIIIFCAMKYLVVIALPLDLSSRLAKIQRLYRSPRWNIALPPHITLLPPAKLRSSKKELITTLAKIAGQFSSFEIEIVGVGKFKNRGNAIFAKIGESPKLSELHQCLSNQIKNHLEFKNQRHFRPHITLSSQLQRNEAKEKFDVIKKLVPKAKFLCEKITLFSKSDSARKYQKVAEFAFK